MMVSLQCRELNYIIEGMMTGATANTTAAAQWMHTDVVYLCATFALMRLADGEP